MEYGYVKKRRPNDKRPKITSKPFHYISSDGYHIYVGKNNYQNEELTFRFANGNDWWFHAKGIPGSHVILKNDGKASCQTGPLRRRAHWLPSIPRAAKMKKWKSTISRKKYQKRLQEPHQAL